MRNEIGWGINTPYRQDSKRDLWLPVKTAGIKFLVKAIVPPLAIYLEAVLIGRSFGLLLLTLAALATAYNLGKIGDTPAPDDRIRTGYTWTVAAIFMALWLVKDAWPSPVRYRLFFEWGYKPVMYYSLGGYFQNMRWLFALRLFGIAVLPYALPETFEALDWRLWIETWAPSFANSLVAPKKEAAAAETPTQRATSAPLEGQQAPNLLGEEQG